MVRRFQVIGLLVCVLMLTACGSDKALSPEATSGAFLFRVDPARASLFTTGQKNSVQLTTAAYDEGGWRIPGPYPTAYSSSAPGIARVSEGGVVTGVAPGAATITTTVTIGGVVRAVTTPVTVAVDPFDSWRIAGVYELIGQVTGFDPAWGDLTGYQYAAALTVSSSFDVSADASGEVGTFTLLTDGGARSGQIIHSGPVGSALFTLQLGTSFAATATSVAERDGNGVASVIEGHFRTGGHITGTFVATLRSW